MAPQEVRMSHRPRNTLFTILLYVAFFASGASSLIAEVTWNRMLIVVVGNSLSATALILIVFMGGLGLGSYVGGKLLSGRRVSLIPYAVLEALIGLYVLLSPVLFGGLTELFRSLAVGNADQVGLTVARVLVSMLALLLPASLMGATFPAIVNGAALDTPSGRAARTGYLYSTNTLGAAVGCFAAGYHLLFEFGVQTTLAVAFVSYLLASLAGLIAGLIQRGEASATSPSTASRVASASGLIEGTDSSGVGGDPARVRVLYIGVTVVGFVALAYEVLLTRMAILYLGNSISVFALVLTAFLLGTGFSAIFGTWLYGWLRDRGGPANLLFGWSALIASVLIVAVPYALLEGLLVDLDDLGKFVDAAPANPLRILALLITPTVFIGALLPLAIRMLQPIARGETTRKAATLYSLNTAGGLVGAGVINHYVVPAVGVQGALALLIFLMGGTGVASLLVGRWRDRSWVPGFVTAAILGGLVMTLLPNTADLYADRLARSTLAREAGALHVREGRAATVVVLDQKDPNLGTYRDMYLNGVEEASTRYWHVQLFKLLGILPPLLHESEAPMDAVVIAFGAGITAGSVLASDQVASLDVVDLNPDIEGINDLFTDVNGDVFHRDRFHFHNDDGRNYLVTCDKQYDLIISDSTHPRAYDSWILYTRDFYEDVKSHLKPGGIFAQWVPVLRSMRGELMRVHLNTFQEVFPNTTVWYIYGSDQAFLLAMPEPLSIDAPKLQARLDRLPEWFRADEYQLDTVESVAGFFWMDAKAIDLMVAGDSRINTDGVHYFDKQSAVWPLPPQFSMPSYQTSAIPYFKGLTRAQAETVQIEQRVAGYLANLAFYETQADLHRAYCLDPTNGTALWYMHRAFGGQIPDAESFCAEMKVEEFRQLVAHQPNNASYLNGLADALCSAGKCEEALPIAKRAQELAPADGAVLDTYGWALLRTKRTQEAIQTLRRARDVLPNHPVVNYHLGVALYEAGERAQAKARLEHALQEGPNHAQAAAVIQLLEQIEGES